MYKVVFYRDKNGISEVAKHIKLLRDRINKDNNIKFNKTMSYLRKLREEGLSLGMPYIKHIEDDIWELRPLRDRILFAYFDNNKFVLLSYFMKQTQKTPRREIEKAKRLLRKYKERNDLNE